MSVSEQITVFELHFPNAGSWPLSSPWITVVNSPGAAWASPNDIHLVDASSPDSVSTFPTTISSKGGTLFLTALTTGASFGFGFTLDLDNSTNNGYFGFADASGLGMQKNVSGVVTPLFSDAGFTSSPGDIVEFRVSPLNATVVISVFVNGVIKASIVDATPFTLSALYPLFEPYSTGLNWDFGSLICISFATEPLFISADRAARTILMTWLESQSAETFSQAASLMHRHSGLLVDAFDIDIVTRLHGGSVLTGAYIVELSYDGIHWLNSQVPPVTISAVDGGVVSLPVSIFVPPASGKLPLLPARFARAKVSTAISVTGAPTFEVAITLR